MRRCDYEVALRERLKLRKNLNKEEWYQVGVQIALRKRQGKETEVVWNNVPMAPHKVRKDVGRHRQYLPKRQHARYDKSTLPAGLVLRTPPSSPLQQAAFSAPLQSGAPISGARNPASDEAAVPDQLSTSKLVAYRERAFFNHFIPELLHLAQLRALPIDIPEDNLSNPVPRLFGDNPSCEVIARSSFILSNRIHSCNYWKSQEAHWFRAWCGSSADPALLWAFFSMRTPTVHAIYENLLNAAGEFKDVSLFTGLYNLRHAVGDDSAGRRSSLFRTAVSIGSNASPTMLRIAQETSRNSGSAGAVLGSVSGQPDVSWAMSKAAIQADLPMMQLCIGIGAHLGEDKCALGPILKNLLGSEAMSDNHMEEYAHLLLQGDFFLKDQPKWPEGDTGLHLWVWEMKGLTLDRLIYECFPGMRRRLYELFEGLIRDKTRVSLAGILTFAQDGPGALKKYLHSHEKHGSDCATDILERCLSEAAYLGEVSTCSTLLEAGVDPNIPSLSQGDYQRPRAPLWNPLARAAMAGNPEILRLLLADKRLDICSFLTAITPRARMRRLVRARRGIFTPESLFFRERPDSSEYQQDDLRRVEAIEIIRTVAENRKVNVDAHILQAILGFSTKSYGTREHRRGPSAFYKAFCRFNVDSSQVLLIPGLLEKNSDFQIHGMDLLHLSIENECSLRVAKFLLQRGFEIHSRPCPVTGNTMLHSALLSQSMDRSDIVDLLLQGGADHMVYGGGMTILETSLADDAGTFSRPMEYLAVFKRLFYLGSPIVFPQGRRVGPERRCLINLLLEAKAEDTLIMKVIEAGADVNDRGGGTGGHTTPLQQAIERGRLTLAAELIQRGADVCAPPGEDRYGFHYTALQKACATNAPLSFIRRLVEAGADVNEPTPARGPGLSSLEYAARLGSLNLAQYLLEQGAKLNSLGSASGCDPFTRNPAGIHRTRPLDWAACEGRLDMVSFLLEAGGRSGRPGTTGLDGAIDAAGVHRNHFAVARVLRAWAAAHASRLLEAEAAWQRTNPDTSSELLEVASENDVSEPGDSITSGDSDDSGWTDEPLA